ncbi:hypothetical protein [Streptomyces tsukubensis]|uniref:hypothetical protein n=1 Tax=Streptomyces tsukubensis TaxID=83656 RepID=UPI0015C39E96|nr:hypothetical protein [Streptomyces tsukubensis]
MGRPEGTGREAERRSRTVVRPDAHLFRVLPLGTGLICVGLGLGVAFFALRMRWS